VSDVSFLLPGLAGLLGVALGAALTSSAQERHWRTEVRLKAYLELIAAARKVLWRGDEIGRTPEGRVKEKDAVRQATFDLRQAVTQVSLLGPKRIKRVTSELVTLYRDDLYDFFMALESEPLLREPVVAQARNLLLEFQRAAEEVLGVAKAT
jgi:hypothetical protein